MSTIESDDLESTGYFLPEESQLRLKKLREYVVFLANLARPRTSDEVQQWTAEIRASEVATCLELLEEQIGQVLGELSWPARRGEGAAVRSGDVEPVAVEAEALEPEVPEVDDEELEAAEEECDSTGKPYVFGVTLDQIDEIDQLIRMIRAHGDVVIASDDAEFADHTLSTLGDAIFRDVETLREIIRDVNGQRLRPLGHRRTSVREEPAAYHALPVRLHMVGTSHIVPQHPTYQ